VKIIKPYGRSHVERVETGERRRVLRLRSEPNHALDIEEFARSHDRLVITQWVSVIDKIATKPQGTNGPTTEQREFRDRLGNAAWAFLENKELLRGLSNPSLKEHLNKFWRVKIAPYGAAPYRPPKTPGKASPSAKGKWYERFIGDVAVSDVDAAPVVQRIAEHLYDSEFRLSTAVPSRQRGQIAGRASSISINVLRATAPEERRQWTEADRQTYGRAGNIAQQIRLAAQRRERGDDRAGTKRVTASIAAAELFQHFAKVFRGREGTPLPIREVRQSSPGLLNLHMAVKDFYSAIIKHHQKAPRERTDPRTQKGDAQQQRLRKVSDLLPASNEELFALLDGKAANRDLSALVRLGKVIHYEASGPAEDRTAALLRNWPADVSASFFWTSDGQAVIKRNEAFVRVWRHALALASRTLMDWADPTGQIRGDILLRRPIDLVTGDAFDDASYLRKLDLLYGNRASIFRGSDASFHRRLLRLALEGIAELRHSAFHFKGLGTFADALRGAPVRIDEDVLAAIRQLWDKDAREQAGQLLKTMRTAQFDYFFTASQNQTFADTCRNVELVPLALPRFPKMLRRAENAWSEGKGDLRLPRAANRIELETPSRFAQYTAAKLIYDGPFRFWLHRCKAPVLNGFIDQAVARSTAAARDLNAGDDTDRQEIIVAKAAVLGRLDDDDEIEEFFFDLSAETATEMRVQRGYTSDADNAREQASYIENLKCDVVALAFSAYLREAKLDFILDLSAELPRPAAPLCDLNSIVAAGEPRQGENWQAILYFLMHLVPVEEVGQLLHQIRKWETLGTKHTTGDAPREAMSDTALRVQQALELYLDMHDAKFEGGAMLIGTDAFKELFESAVLFERIFPKHAGTESDRRIPRRGLREIMRFGHLPAVRAIFVQHKVTGAEASRYFEGEAAEDGKPRIVRSQEARERLHEKWTKTKRDFPLQDVRAYVEALSSVVRHRHLASHVTLTDHVRLHRLLMTVLGRLVDYAGLWERDLYFATLALISHQRARPDEVFTDEGLRHLGNGRITAALRNRRTTAEAQAVATGLERHFGRVFERGCLAVRLRNDFAHFNMLKPGSPPVDLTDCVNAARHLMAYDRKLKNAVSKSVKERLHRDGLSLSWTMEATAGHHLGPTTLQTRQARHLGKIRLRESGRSSRDGRPPRRYSIVENLHSDQFVRMAAALFARSSVRDQRSVVDLPLDRIDWQPSAVDQRPRTPRYPDIR
jgi:hypothetical protein